MDVGPLFAIFVCVLLFLKIRPGGSESYLMRFEVVQPGTPGAMPVHRALHELVADRVGMPKRGGRPVYFVASDDHAELDLYVC